MTEFEEELKRQRSGLSVSRIILGLLPVAVIVFVFILRPDPDGLGGQTVVGAWSTTMPSATTQPGDIGVRTVGLNINSDQTCNYFTIIDGETTEFTGKWAVKSKKLLVEWNGKKAQKHFGSASVEWPIDNLEGDVMRIKTIDGEGTYKRIPKN